jgi:hypothetical protein
MDPAAAVMRRLFWEVTCGLERELAPQLKSLAHPRPSRLWLCSLRRHGDSQPVASGYVRSRRGQDRRSAG